MGKYGSDHDRGFTSDEGYVLLNRYLAVTQILQATTPLENMFPLTSAHAVGHPTRRAWAERVRALYGIQLPLTEANAEQITTLVGDQIIKCGVDATIDARLNAAGGGGGGGGSAPTYLYRFNYYSYKVSFGRRVNAGRTNLNVAPHSEDCLYLFNYLDVTGEMDGEDMTFSRYLVSEFFVSGECCINKIFVNDIGSNLDSICCNW